MGKKMQDTKENLKILQEGRKIVIKDDKHRCTRGTNKIK